MVAGFSCLTTKDASIIILEAMPPATVRGPQTTMERKPEENLTRGDALVFHSSLAPSNAVKPAKKAR